MERTSKRAAGFPALRIRLIEFAVRTGMVDFSTMILSVEAMGSDAAGADLDIAEICGTSFADTKRLGGGADTDEDDVAFSDSPRRHRYRRRGSDHGVL